MQRYYYFDVLRIVSICAVVVIHVASPYLSAYELGSLGWQAGNIFDSISRWSVPVFVMISGALFLDPQRPQLLHKLWSKNIARIATLIVFWNVIYALLYVRPDSLSMDSLYQFAKMVVLGDVHMWFLYMIIGLYIATPILRHVAASEQLMRYFLATSFIAGLLVPFLTSFGHLGLLRELFDSFKLNMFIGFPFYFMAGAWLSRIRITDRSLKGIVVAGALSVAVTAIMTALASIYLGHTVETYLDFFSPFVCLTSAAVFLAARRFVSHDGCEKRPVLIMLSKASLGVYLIHVIVLRLLMSFSIQSFIPFEPLALLVTAGAGIICSFALSLLLNQIPVIKKYFI